jgi:eukaryotic-like serine/threonine-protein kinase
MAAIQTTILCPVCRKPLAANTARGLCPQCLLGEVLNPTPISGAATEKPAPTAQSFGDYQILGEIAEGGMGVVYYARQVSLNRAVALKMIRSGHLASASEVQRFRTEAEAAARLDHPNIVPIYEIAEHGGRHYFSMKLLDGGNLAERSRQRRFTTREAAALVATVARTVQHAHERGILHRDIKPTNILLDDNGEPHLSDFGLAKLFDGTGDLTQTRTVVGTPAYMAPEQASGGPEQVTTAADVYSLGVILYELLAGRPPFGGETALEILQQVQTKDPPPLRALRPDVDRDLEAICLKCLEKEPSRRYPTAQAFGEELEAWLGGRPVRARPVTPWERTAKWARRNRALAALSAAAAMILLAGLIGIFVQWRRAELNALASRDRLVRLHVANGTRLLDAGDNFGALVPFAEAFKLEHDRPDRHRSHQLRLASVMRQSPKLLHMWFPGAPVNSAEFSRDGRSVLAASGTNCISIWSVEHTGTTVTLLHPGPDKVTASFSADAQTVLSVNRGEARLWAARTGKMIRGFADSGLRKAALSPDGKWVATGNADGSLKLWNTSGEASVATMKMERAVGGLVFSATGTRVLGRDHGTVRIWSVPAGNLIAEIRPGTDIRAAAFDNYGLRVATARSDGSARVWDATTGEAISPLFKESYWLTDIKFSPDGKRVIAAAGGHRANVWNLETGKRVQLSGHQNVVVSAAFSPSGERTITASFDGTARVYETSSGKPLTPPLRHSGLVTAAEFSPDGMRVLTAGADGTVRVWSLWPDAQTVVPGGEENVRLIGTMGDGSALLVQPDRGSLEVWDTRSWQPLFPPVAVTNTVLRAWLSPDRKTLLAVSYSGALTQLVYNVDLWDPVSGKLINHLSIPGKISESVVASLDCARIAVTGPDRVLVFDAATGRQVILSNVPQGVILARFSAAGDALLLVRTNEAHVFDLASGRARFAPLCHSCPIKFANFGRTGRYLVTCALDSLLEPREAQVWDALTGTRVGPPLRHLDGVFYATFSADDRMVVTASEDGTARIWNAITGDALSPPLRHSVAVEHASFSPDGRWVATASSDKSARVWDTATGEPVTPRLIHEWRVDEAVFLANGRYLLTRSALVVNSIWNLGFEAYSIDNLHSLVTLLSGHKLDATGALAPVDTSELESRWNQLRAVYPGAFQTVPWRYASAIPARSTATPPTCVDLGPWFNALLSEAGNPAATNSEVLPQGLQKFEDAEFDLRGVVQLAGTALMGWGTRAFPEAVGGIVVGQRCNRIHLLMSTTAFAERGTRVASIFMKYDDGSIQEMPIIAGEHVGDRQTWPTAAKPTVAREVWTGRQVPSRTWSRSLSWYKMTWENPRPHAAIVQIDLVSAMTTAAPYLLAITVEPASL